MMNYIVVSSFGLKVSVKRHYIPIIDDVCLGAAFLMSLIRRCVHVHVHVHVHLTNSLLPPLSLLLSEQMAKMISINGGACMFQALVYCNLILNFGRNAGAGL